uniref:Centrosomal protein 89 n=1 Tax=Nothobranchius kuhntae TaxID=321403 RepID=A0A1A8JCP7_NOTKU
MLKFNFRREKDEEFKHIAPGMMPAASIAPKAAVPRTPPPQRPHPLPNNVRSAVSAAILSSSLTGRTLALPPPARLRSFSGIDPSKPFTPEPNLSTALYSGRRWSEDLASRSHLSSPNHSEGELEARGEDVDNQEDEEHIYQTLVRQENLRLSGAICDRPVEAKSSTPPAPQMSGRPEPSSVGLTVSTEGMNTSVRQSPENWRSQEPCGSFLPVPAADLPRHTASDLNQLYSQVHREKNTGMVDKQTLQEKRPQRLEQEAIENRASPDPKPSAGSPAELQSLRQHAQELVDKNDALKLLVHRLSVELSRYQARFRPLSEQESSKISRPPTTGPPPPWLLDMKHMCPLLLAYEDRMKEQDTILQTKEEEVKKLRLHVDEAIKEKERLHDDISKIGVASQTDCQQLQQQALLVLQENQVLMDQLEAQRVKAKASHSRHQSEAIKVSKQLMLLEAEKQSLQEDLEESRKELQKRTKEVQVLQAHLKDVITWDEHCSITEKLRRQLEQQESKSTGEMEQVLLRVSRLEDENRSLAADKANIAADARAVKAELELCRQANRKAERRVSTLKRQKEEWKLKEKNTLHHLGAVVSVAQHISKEKDQLLNMASTLQEEKQRFVTNIQNGTLRFSKLQEEIKVYRRQASTRLAALEEAVEGKTASCQREILHLQRLLRERQEAEEKLLQSKRELEEELKVVWQVASRENQHMKETLLDSKVTCNLHGWTHCGSASHAQLAPTTDETRSSSEETRAGLLLLKELRQTLQRRRSS